MNIKVEVHLAVPEDKFSAEGVGEVTGAIADALLEQGYGNVAEENVEDTIIKSLLTVKPQQEFTDDKAWLASAVKGAWAVVLPTADEDFAYAAKSSEIKELVAA